MASLTGNLVAETYKALLKTIDNDILTASEKQITDGFGGGSNVFIDSNGFLRANKYKVTNGLATQFLKADGSLDANTYLTSITSSQIIAALGFTPVTNARTLTINGTTYDLSANRSWTIAGTSAVWGNITGTLSNQTDLQNALNAKFNNPTGTISQYIRGDGSIATFPTITGGLPIGGTTGQILAKINATDYNTEWIDNFATQTKNEVKLGQTLTKGAAVYVSSANGTNIIVSAASNTTEALSSKTFGLLETGGATNAFVKCVTFGLLAGLDTSTATAGDPVWLGVNGALIFGLANKPFAPAHLVYIGVVTRVQSNNGEIFVNVQNGFELKEIHDVAAQTPTNNDGLFYESATSLWKNKSIATVLGYTPQAQLNGTGFVKATGTTISYDNSTYLTTGDAASTYQLLTNLSTDLTASATKYPSVNAVVTGLGTKQPLDADLTAIAALVGTTGFLIKTAADTWSLDTNTYLTTTSAASTYLTQTTAASTYQRLDKMVSNLLASSTEYPNSNAVLAKLALKADAANPVFTGDLSISGATPRLYFVDTDQNPDYTIFVDSGYFYIYDQTAGATKFQITPSGNAINTGTLTSASFIKSGGTASQYLMADGSVTTLSGLVTGSGTTNYLPKWTSASALGNSILFETTGFANIAGDLKIESTEPQIYLTKTGTDAGIWRILGSTGQTLRRFRIYDEIAGLDRFDIFSSGNVSIGTTTDSGYKLDVNGSLRIQGVNPSITTDSATDYTIINARKNGTRTWQIDSVSGNFWLYMQGAANYALQIAGSTGAAVFSSSVTADGFGSGISSLSAWGASPVRPIIEGREGNAISNYVGLPEMYYTSNAYYNGTAWIRKSANASMNMVLSGYNNNFLIQSGPTGAANGIITFSTLFLINGSNGNVGIGNSGASNLLTIGQDATIHYTQTGIAAMTLKGLSSGARALFEIHSADAAVKLVLQSVSGYGVNLGALTASDIHINNSSGNITIKAGGNVLIGSTTDSGYKLDVNGTLKTSGDIFTTSTLKMSGSSSYNWMIQNYNDGNWGFGMFNSGSQYYPTVYFSGDGTNDRGFRVRNVNGGTNSFLVNSLGNGTFLGSVTATSFFESSDNRLKKLIDGSAQIAGIENLEAKLYEKNGKIEFGYFAQDAQEFMPYSVEKNMDGFLTLSYREVHTAKIARLEQRVAELEKQLNAA